MKNAFWNVLSFFVFMSIIAVIAVFGLIFLNPYSQLNPFPPPTVPVALILPSSTPTYQQLPPTWTPGSGDQQMIQPDLKPSSTPFSSEQPVVIVMPSRTSFPTATNTPTATITPTRTPAVSNTPSITPNKTNTALALIATNAEATSKAKTATALAGGPGPTLTAAAMPPNPSSASETHGVPTNSWQRSVANPSFTWSAVSQAAGYYVYWGSDANGVSTSFVTSTSYTPAAVTTTGTYYLRLRTIFAWGGERPDWTTVFTFRYDNTIPGTPGSASETHGVSNGVWQNSVSSPAFTWTNVTDTGSGLAGYDIYFGNNSGGEFVSASPTSPAYSSGSVASGTFYLRARAVDKAGNTSGWATIFTFLYDGAAPSAPTNLQTSDLPGSTTPTFTWSASSDGYSGLAAYEIFWGSGSACGAKNQPDTISTSFTTPAITETGEYHLCVRARDNAGNTSGWAEASFNYSP